MGLRHVLFVALRGLWVGANAAAFLVAVWYSTLPPIEGTHPGFLLAPVWLVLLFPGVVAMVAAFAVVDAVVPAWVVASAGRLIFFSIWGGGAALTYAFWFVWLPRWTRRRTRPAGT